MRLLQPSRLVVLAILLLPASVLAQEQEIDYDKKAPFTDIVWSGEQPNILLDGAWYELTALNGILLDDLIASSREIFGENWQRRINEDLVELLHRMGHPPGETISAGLIDRESGRSFTRHAIPMTAANRNAVMDAIRAREAADERPATLTENMLDEDISVLRDILARRFSYVETNGVDLSEALDDLWSNLEPGMSVDAFGVEIKKVIALFIDGHAGVSGASVPEGFLPVLVFPDGQRFLAVAADRSGFFDPERPYLTHIDGKPIEFWLGVVDPMIAEGSPQYVLWQALGDLRGIQYLRMLAGREQIESVTLRVTDKSDVRPKVHTVNVDASFPTYGDWPRTGSSILDGDVGYLRLTEMDDDAVAEIRTWMPRFRGTRGLVIDVRHNRGGSREALIELAPYFIRPDETPWVVNAAKYRRYEDYKTDHLESRFMHRAEWPGWTNEERAAIRTFITTFTPEWNPPADQFSDWHYLVLARRNSDTRYHFDRPVVVLSDAKSFSATDIFLGALKGRPDVTIVGEPSGGGSANSEMFRLPNSQLDVQVGSMASFQPSGLLYDGNGVEPDIMISPSPSFWLSDGQDRVLEEAIQIILRK